MELLDDIEFFDCMDTCPDVFSLLDESDINFINYSNDELFTELAMSDESTREPVNTSHDKELDIATTLDSSLVDDTSQDSNNTTICSTCTIDQVSHDHSYAINGCCTGTEYNCVAEQRSLLVDSMVTDESRDQLTVIASNDHTIKLIATTAQEDQGYDTMSSSNSPIEAQDTGTPLSVLEEKIKRYAKLEVGLTQEEKQCLLAEGLPVPTTLPLTKREEEALKTVRKKLRNKFAAHQSRRRKKEHVELLERQVRQYGITNHDLQQKVTHLQQENRSLLTELAKLRGIISKQTLRGNSQPALLCCILVLCFAILIGQFNPIRYQASHEDHYTATVPSRTLLSVKTSSNIFSDFLHSWQLRLYSNLMSPVKTEYNSMDGNHSNNEHINIAE